MQAKTLTHQQQTARLRLIVQGQVQGVGFRPFVFVLAEELGLTGFVQNTSLGVVIEVQGLPKNIANFAQGLLEKLPPLAKITALQKEEIIPLANDHVFEIRQSLASTTHNVLVSPDMSLCKDCQQDMQDSSNSRWAYPFTNCTNCGPRYSITHSIPYDREFTSMACFEMCADCQKEYTDPRNRRFHAQPNACPKCGPQIWLVENTNLIDKTNLNSTSTLQSQTQTSLDLVSKIKGTELPSASLHNQAAILALCQLLLQGKIAAVKGLGGFHLVCDASNQEAVALLRQRKNRPHKALALMFGSVEDAKKIVHLHQQAEDLLLSQEHPVVICHVNPHGQRLIAPNLAPDTLTLGIMLPYTPLHSCLFSAFAEASRKIGKHAPPALVMTSGNMAGNPICLGNREALEQLAPLADVFLLHNRDILIRVDDSVICPNPELGNIFFRRARGYVPSPIELSQLTNPASRQDNTQPVACVLGIGADLKNTLCLSKNDQAFVSQHIGDMENLETLGFHQSVQTHLQKLLKVEPEFVICDLHPNFASTQRAKSLGLPVLQLQHHFAHAHAVLEENQQEEPALVLALDGTGLGNDNTLWGGELLFVCPKTLEHRRLASLAPLLLPSGEMAIKEPWRITHALMLELGLVSPSPTDEEKKLMPWLGEFANLATFLPQIVKAGFNCNSTTSAGRLFDAASAALGLCHKITYEGQAAIRLESAQFSLEDDQFAAIEQIFALPAEKLYPCPLLKAHELNTLPCLDTHSLFKAMVLDSEKSTCECARLFHASLAFGLTNLAALYCKELGISAVGLSGGCLQNMTLASLLVKGLRQRGLTPLWHKKLPPSDACLSFGQVAWGRRLLHKNNGNLNDK